MKRFKLCYFAILNLITWTTLLAHGHDEHHHFHWDDAIIGLLLITLIFIIWSIYLKRKKSK
ncbi:MAG: hypothetical protein K9M49_08450 [Candidatus Marinimicrobia bacterium]|nr:hypothetical protein [Candidatus Neomarinimicrobiota bacterium]MCF7851356.1 hypothetical protein [Candidatus Neomarinimicrobiota bacterium]MCF7905166.1 hypothetical protein [Candidatus Neomarinimicrobiota bacterium]